MVKNNVDLYIAVYSIVQLENFLEADVGFINFEAIIKPDIPDNIVKPVFEVNFSTKNLDEHKVEEDLSVKDVSSYEKSI